jgi:hypothetical protein
MGEMMKLFYSLLCSGCLSLAACTPDHSQQPKTWKPDMTQFAFATSEEVASQRVDFTQADMRLIEDILASASRVISQQSTLEQEMSLLGTPNYFVPKLPTEEIRSVGFDRGRLSRFPAENDWDTPSVFKGFSIGFGRNATKAPWTNFGIDVKHPYEYTVTLPVTSEFLDALGLVLVKTVPDQPCEGGKGGKCHAFMYRSSMYPKLGYIFLTDQDRSDLKSGLPTNFRSVEIRVI